MIKQVIVMRRDLKMRRGKEIAQGSHASIKFLSNKLREAKQAKNDGHTILLSDAEQAWIDGPFTKICLRVDSEEELLEINDKAKEAGLVCSLIQDRGKTEFKGVPTYTCLAIGPDEAEKIDKITGELRLY